MPDFTNRMVGEVKGHDPRDRKQMAAFNHVKRDDGTTEAVLALGNERFTPPELLFRPENVGMRQAGVAEMVMQSLVKVPTGLWGIMLGNVWVVGGNAKLPGFEERLYNEIRELAPVECTVRVKVAPDPIKATWLGGARLASNPTLLKETMVTKQEYQEYGGSWLLRKFA
ncbi:MAG: hypothetical protein LQ340_001845 [Diploschistes diacapsis]|nr:MAG: hypothetical protein LQ340_001845 [Diploschistes diacapsis]